MRKALIILLMFVVTGCGQHKLYKSGEREMQEYYNSCLQLKQKEQIEHYAKAMACFEQLTCGRYVKKVYTRVVLFYVAIEEYELATQYLNRNGNLLGNNCILKKEFYLDFISFLETASGNSDNSNELSTIVNKWLGKYEETGESFVVKNLLSLYLINCNPPLDSSLFMSGNNIEETIIKIREEIQLKNPCFYQSSEDVHNREQLRRLWLGYSQCGF